MGWVDSTAGPVLSIIITDKSGSQRRMDFEAVSLRIGRLEDNDVVLPKTNVSKHHAGLTCQDGRYVVTDLQSTNGTFVNGRRISGPTAIRPGDKVYVGDFIIGLSPTAVATGPDSRSLPPAPPVPPGPTTRNIKVGHTEPDGPTRNFPAPHSEPPIQGLSSVRPPVTAATADANPPGAGPTVVPAAMPDATSPGRPPTVPARTSAGPPTVPVGSSTRPPGVPAATPAQTISQPLPHSLVESRPSRPPRPRPSDPGQGPLTSPAILAPSVRLQGALCTLMEQLAEHMDIFAAQERPFPSEHSALLDGLISDLITQGIVGPDLDRRFLRDATVSEAVGLGPLDRLLSAKAVREVVVDAPDRILADLGGGLTPVSAFFSSARAVHVAAQRLLSGAERQLSGKAPVQEALLRDGSHLTVLNPPFTQTGPVLSIRCPDRSSITVGSLVTEGVMSADMVDLLRNAVRARLNILVCGPRGRGVSGIVSAIAGLSPEHERVVSLERRPGLSIAHPQWISLSRHAINSMGCDEAIEHAARLRYDRLVFDEIKAGDVLPVLTAASCERGLLIGLRAASAQAGLQQLEMLSTIGTSHGSAGAAALLGQAVQLVVYQHADDDGSRRIDTIAQVEFDRGRGLRLRPLFEYQNGFKATEHRAGFQPD